MTIDIQSINSMEDSWNSFLDPHTPPSDSAISRPESKYVNRKKPAADTNIIHNKGLGWKSSCDQVLR